MQSVDLSFNSIKGQIPSSICELNLRFLCLRANKIEGGLPLAIGQIVTLEFLCLNSNCLSGLLPETVGNLVALKHLDVANNPQFAVTDSVKGVCAEKLPLCTFFFPYKLTYE